MIRSRPTDRVPADIAAPLKNVMLPVLATTVPAPTMLNPRVTRSPATSSRVLPPIKIAQLAVRFWVDSPRFGAPTTFQPPVQLGAPSVTGALILPETNRSPAPLKKTDPPATLLPIEPVLLAFAKSWEIVRTNPAKSSVAGADASKV